MKNISLAVFFTVLTTFLLTFLTVVIDEHPEWMKGLFKSKGPGSHYFGYDVHMLRIPVIVTDDSGELM